MPSPIQHKTTPLDRILVIDDLPLIPLAIQEVFRSVNSAVLVEYSENVFTALSAKTFADTHFDLVIIGSIEDGYSDNLRQSVTELKERFGQPLIVIYSSSYDPLIIEKMSETGIDAYVHKHEPVDEVRKAYRQLSAGQSYLSAIFRTLFHDYNYRLRK